MSDGRSEKKAACLRCKWRKQRKCHFNPPSMEGFPEVSMDDFCREFQKEEKA